MFYRDLMGSSRFRKEAPETLMVVALHANKRAIFAFRSSGRCSFNLAGPKPKEVKVETFRIDYLIRTSKVEKLSLQPRSNIPWLWA